MSEELLDYFDEDLNLLGKATRVEIHTKGLWHKTFHCWLIQQENNREYILFQQRSWQKPNYPDKLDITAAGHIQSGEAETEGLRELAEELGIEAQSEDLLFLGVRKSESQVGAEINREFCYTYFLETKRPLTAYQLQVEEVSGLVQAELRHFLDLINRRITGFWATGAKLNLTQDLQTVRTIVRRNNLLPHPDEYYRQICQLAQQYFKGERVLKLSPLTPGGGMATQ
jgi:isopentenyldiphosphate isomerase